MDISDLGQSLKPPNSIKIVIGNVSGFSLQVLHFHTDCCFQDPTKPRNHRDGLDVLPLDSWFKRDTLQEEQDTPRF